MFSNDDDGVQKCVNKMFFLTQNRLELDGHDGILTRLAIVGTVEQAAVEASIRMIGNGLVVLGAQVLTIVLEFAIARHPNHILDMWKKRNCF